MSDPSDHLLRTFAAVPIDSKVLDVGCGDGLQTEALIQLGFDVFGCDPSPENVESVRVGVAVHIGEKEARKRISRARIDALGYPDAYFHWAVAYGSLARLESRAALLEGLAEVRRVLRPGGWLYVTVPAIPEAGVSSAEHGYAGDSAMRLTFTPRTLDDLTEEANFAVAEGTALVLEKGARVVQGIYRRVETDTPR